MTKQARCACGLPAIKRDVCARCAKLERDRRKMDAKYRRKTMVEPYRFSGANWPVI